MTKLTFILVFSAITSLCHWKSVVSATSPRVVVYPPRFSFREWVEEIILNPQATPNGNHLSPEEAIAAWQAHGSSSLLQKTTAITDSGPRILAALGDPATCNESNHKRAPIPDAVHCINDLARRGNEACLTNGYALYCQYGTALIDGAGKEGENLSSYCNDIARGAGYIMDSCSWTDNTVEGAGYVEGNGDILIRIHNTVDITDGN